MSPDKVESHWAGAIPDQIATAATIGKVALVLTNIRAALASCRHSPNSPGLRLRNAG